MLNLSHVPDTLVQMLLQKDGGKEEDEGRARLRVAERSALGYSSMLDYICIDCALSPSSGFGLTGLWLTRSG